MNPASGPVTGGTSVEVTGANFASGATVDFGSVPATNVTVVSLIEITADSPAQAAGTVNVTVTTPGGTSSTSTADQFTYQAAYTPLAPTRICDTRSGNPSSLSGPAAQCNGKTLAPGKVLDVTVENLAGVPASGVSAVALNVTAINPAGNGYLTVYPAGEAAPMASNLNFNSRDVVANLVEVGIGAGGQVAIVSNAATDIVVDMEGYYSVASSPGAGYYDPTSPARICDTRSGNPSSLSGPVAQCNGHTLSTGTTLKVAIGGVSPVPASGVSAVALNVTAVDFTNNGYLTVFPAGGNPPVASNVNFVKGQGAVPNAVVVPLGSSGDIEIFGNARTDIVIDVVGWYTSRGGTGSQFNAMPAPVRICDTRPGNPSSLSGSAAQCNGHAMASGTTAAIRVAGVGGVPSGAKAVAVNVTVTNTPTSGYLTAFPGGTQPTASNLNWTRGETVPNLAIAELSPSGTLSLYCSAGTDVIVDVLGWYQ